MVFIGLGNPGSQYHETRHNVGFMVLDRIASKLSLRWKKPFFRNFTYTKGVYKGKEFILVKPLTFMNRSGLIFKELYTKGWIDSGSPFTVICDNMDLAYGECRIKTRGIIPGHNGLKSIIENIPDQEFIRLYIGISRPPSQGDIVKHVLEKPDDKEFPDFINGVDRGVEISMSLINNSVLSVMNEYNRKNIS